MNWVFGFELHNVTFECDSKILVDAVHSRGVGTSDLSTIVTNIRRFLDLSYNLR